MAGITPASFVCICAINPKELFIQATGAWMIADKYEAKMY